MRETEERKKREERREPVEIKIEIRPSQLQMIITFDRKLQLRRSTRPRKDNDEIYMANRYSHYHHFLGQKILSSS
jgi:hypothetical protein